LVKITCFAGGVGILACLTLPAILSLIFNLRLFVGTLFGIKPAEMVAWLSLEVKHLLYHHNLIDALS
jgi:hypothetical protein